MGARRDPWLWLVVGLSAVHTGALAPLLLVSDLNLSYPFPGGDGHDWIANALALAGEDVRYTGRPPLLPLLLAGLDGWSGMEWFPVVQQILFGGLVIGTYLWLRREHEPAAAGVAALALLVSPRVQATALEVMADLLGAVLLLLAAACFAARGRRPGALVAAGLFAGLGALAQPVALLLLPAAAAACLLRRPAKSALPALGAGALLAAGLPLAWELLGPPGSGSEGVVGSAQRSLFDPGVGNLDFYSGAALAFLGWPAALAALVGAWRAARAPREVRSRPFVLALAAALALFFGMLYSWPAGRFLVLAAVPGSYLLAEGLSALRPGAFATASTAVLLFAAWPLAPGSPESAVVLWPLPTVAWDPAAPAGARVSTAAVAEAWSGSDLGRARAARRGAGAAPALPSGAFAGDHSVVYLAPRDLAAAERYRVQNRLGNAVRRRVKVVPMALYPADWHGFATLEPLGKVAGAALQRVRLAGRSGSWIVASDPDSAPEAGVTAAPPPANLARAWATAEAIAAAAEPPEGFLVALADARPRSEWLRLLPFAARTTSLFVVERGDPVTAALFAPSERAAERIGRLQLVRRRHLHWAMLVVLEPDPPATPPAAGM